MFAHWSSFVDRDISATVFINFYEMKDTSEMSLLGADKNHPLNANWPICTRRRFINHSTYLCHSFIIFTVYLESPSTNSDFQISEFYEK